MLELALSWDAVRSIDVSAYRNMLHSWYKQSIHLMQKHLPENSKKKSMHREVVCEGIAKADQLWRLLVLLNLR